MGLKVCPLWYKSVAMPIGRHQAVLYLFSICFSGMWGCTTATVPIQPGLLPQQPSEELRATFGKIGVVSTTVDPEAKFELPAKDLRTGMLKGAGEGVVVGGVIGGSLGSWAASFPPPIGIVLLSTGIVGGAIIGTIPGSIYGAFSALPPTTVDTANATLNNALIEFRIQKTMQHHIVQIARKLTDNSLVLVKEQELAGSTKEVAYQALAEKGISSILEFDVPTVWLGPVLVGPNPPLYMVMTIQAWMVSTRSNNLFVSDPRVTLVYVGPTPHLFTEWAADNAQLFRRECDHAVHQLAEKIVEELFVVYPIPP